MRVSDTRLSDMPSRALRSATARNAANAKALSTYMGHASIAITLDTYGHMLPGNEEEAATLLDAYLDRSTGVASV
jgi:integrase